MANPGTVQNNLITPPPYFIGFNTIDQPTPPYSLTNLELIKRDLLNQFMTVPGERVMLPNFGSNIPLYVMDPLDEITQDNIRNDAINIINNEPRVRLVDLQMYSQDQAINIVITLMFLPESIQDNLFLTFTTESAESF